VAKNGKSQLKTIEDKVAKDKSKKADHAKILGMLKEKAGGSWEGPAGVAADFASQVMCSLCDAACFKEKEWDANLLPYLTPFASKDKLAAPLKALLDQCLIDMTPEEEDEEVEDAEELCNCKFTLAYGTKVRRSLTLTSSVLFSRRVPNSNPAAPKPRCGDGTCFSLRQTGYLFLGFLVERKRQRVASLLGLQKAFLRKTVSRGASLTLATDEGGADGDGATTIDRFCCTTPT